MAEEFVPFPTSKRQEIETRQKAKEPYRSPHLPPVKARATNMEVNGHKPSTPPEIALSLPVQAPGFTQPSSEPEAVVLALPSQYAFYDFKDLYVKPFKGIHLSKLSRAKEESSTLHMVEAVSSVLSCTSGEQHLGFKLTLPDFYFVLYWLRLNSFTKSVFVHETTCSNEEHIRKVTEGSIAADTLKIAEIIRKSTLQNNTLESVPNLDMYPLDYPGVTLSPAIMQDAIELTEDPNFGDSEFNYAGQIAVYIRLANPSSLRDRIAIVNEMSPDDITTIKRYETAVTEYGIVEQIEVKCRGCGASRVDEIQLDAHDFLPDGKPARDNG